MYYTFILILSINSRALKIPCGVDPNTQILNLKIKVQKYGSRHKLIATKRLVLNNIDYWGKKAHISLTDIACYYNNYYIL